MSAPNNPQSNPLGNASLVLGILSAALVFGIGFCGLVGANQGWLPVVATLLLVCGASSAFLGLLGAGLGLLGLFSPGKVRAAAAAGLVLGIIGLCLFIGFLSALGGG